MENYVVRINAKTVESLEYVDFERIDYGIVKILANKSKKNLIGKFGFGYPGLSIETYINRSHSVGMVFVSKKLIDKSNRTIVLLKNCSTISGTLDYFNPRFDIDECIDINKGDNLCTIMFRSKEFFDLIELNKTKGIRSVDIDVQVFVDGKFKPYSEKQMEIHGYELIKSSHRDGCKFYERDYIRYEDNWLNEDGSEKDTLLYETCEWIECKL